MASTQFPGMLRFYRKTPNGQMLPILQARVEDTAPAGGAPDGAGSSVATPEKRIFVDSPTALQRNDILLVTFEADAGDSIDASDCIWSIPALTTLGSKQLGRAQFADPALSDQALVASKETTIAGYSVTEQNLRVKGRIFCDIQNDTA